MQSSLALKKITSSVPVVHSLSAQRTSHVDNPGVFPGAFDNKVLTDTCGTNLGLDAISPQDAYRGVAQLGKAIYESNAYIYRAHIQLLSLKLLNYLAVKGPPGSVQIAENLMIKLNEDTGALDRLQPPPSKDDPQLEYPLKLMRKLLFTKIDSQHLGEQVLTTLDVDSNSIPSTTALSTQLDIFRSACGLLIAAHVCGRCYPLGIGDRDQRKSAQEQIHKAIDNMLTLIDVTFERDKITSDYAQLELVKKSNSFRALNLVQTMRELRSKHHAIFEQMHEVYKHNPFCGPKVVLLANRGRFLDEDVSISNHNQALAADARMLNECSFILAYDAGRLVFGHMRYDNEWGLLSVRNSVDVLMQFRSSFLPEEGSYDWTTLAKVVKVFPLVDFEQLDSALTSLSESPRFADYLSNKERRYGPRLRRNKSWLERNPDPDFIGFLKEFTAALKGEPHQIDEKSLKKWENKFSDRIMSSSYFASSPIEDVVVSALFDCVRSGQKLADYNFILKNGHNLFDRIKALAINDISIGSALVFSFDPETLRLLHISENQLSGLLPEYGLTTTNESTSSPLTEFGIEYLLALIDPSERYHEQGDDCRELEEIKALQRYHRYGY